MDNQITVASANTDVALSIREGVTLDEWRDQFRQLATGTRKLIWYLGDLAAYGLSQWPQAVREFIRNSEFEAGTIHTASWVCKQIPPERRRADLCYSVHIEVAALTPNEQDKWLDYYAEQKKQGSYSIAQLRADIRQSAAIPEALEKTTPNRSPVKGIRDFVTFAERQPTDFWTDDIRTSYKEELQPIVDLYNRL